MQNPGTYFLGCLVALLLVLPAGAQTESESPEMAGVILLNKAPISDEVLRVTLPRPRESKLENGMTLMVLEDHRVPSFSVQIDLPVSSLAEPKDLLGVADATASMLTLGTESMDSRELAERLAQLGGSLNASSGQTSTSISVSGLTDNMDELLALLQEVLLKPTFPQEELDKWKQSELARLMQRRTNPDFLASERIAKILYPNDLRGVVAPTEESIRSLTRENILAYYNAHYAPMAGGLVGVAGDVSHDDMAARLNELFADWEGGEPSTPKVEIEAPIKGRRVVLIHRPNSVQTSLVLANRAITRTDPDYFAFVVLNRVLGSGPSSRLFRNIREEKGYTYGIYSSLDAGKYTNDFSAATSVRTEVTGPALREILKEFVDIRDREIPAEELGGAKRALVASLALSLESADGLLSRAISLKHYGLPADYWDIYRDQIASITAERAREVSRKYVPVDNVQIVAVGDAEQIRDVLAEFGEVEEYTVDGERVN